ncbi:ABC transporter ATP-binding protein [Meridianimarinicoccus sp. RP-17]|uniref:ABC transporter ATP-binding protein n=1 Tax=Meridianimarinicoccus zhengii TaxID=2056810 RepID=UPI000DAD8ED5|nr:ABC transporter ATP-binding protein [Phycocomes zhengii]
MVLRIDGLVKSYDGPEGAVRVLDGVALALAAGETLALTGESGSGKSTLLALVAGLDAADSGTIMVAGQVIGDLDDSGRARLRRDAVGLVFQQFNLIPSLTAAANIAIQARLAGRFDPDWAATVTARLGLDGLGDRYPEQLSGGQQQRVAIARTLAARPALILADEPTGNLDEDAADRVLALMLDLVADSGAALLMVTHSPRLAGKLAGRAHLSRGRLA